MPQMSPARPPSAPAMPQMSPARPPSAPAMPLPQMPMLPPQVAPQGGPVRLDGTPANAYRALSAAMLPSPELNSVHGGTSITGSISMVDVRDARASKWTFAVLGIAALLGVIAAIAITLAPQKNSDEQPPRATLDPAPVVQPTSDQTPTEQVPQPATTTTPDPTQAPTVPATAAAPVEQTSVEPPPVAHPPAEVPPAPAATAPPQEQHAEAPPPSEKPNLVTRSRKARSAPATTPPPPKKKATSGNDGTLRVETYDGVYASVFVNGQRDVTPGARYELPAGSYKVRLNNESLRLSKVCTINVSSGKTVTLKVELEEGTCERY
jgi:outer membrane biosynthesis protein TonB